MDRGKAYKALVENVQKHYGVKGDEAPFLVSLDEAFGSCGEINLYTYWQGRGYAENTPSIKYLLVGQDWGNPFSTPPSFQDRIKKIIRGEDLPYIVDEHNIDSGFQTDTNVIALFRHLGYEIAREQYSDLFFTNFCLGYRSGRNSGNMTKALMEKDMESFQKLCELLKPQNILCLGQLTFQCVYAALVKNRVKAYQGGYLKYIESRPKINADAAYGSGRIFPLVHCGGLGLRNRPLDRQRTDWDWVKRESLR
mgnify:FL=1|jgi:hypothetical protein